MRELLNEEAMEKVAGGTVIISRDYMVVGFSSTYERYNLVNCTYKEARDLADDLWESNQSLGDADFDALVKSAYEARGWITALTGV